MLEVPLPARTQDKEDILLGSFFIVSFWRLPTAKRLPFSARPHRTPVTLRSTPIPPHHIPAHLNRRWPSRGLLSASSRLLDHPTKVVFRSSHTRKTKVYASQPGQALWDISSRRLVYSAQQGRRGEIPASQLGACPHAGDEAQTRRGAD